jgi:hypothetical protein
VHRIFWLENLRERPLRRPRHRWEDNITMYLGETGWKGEKWMRLPWDRDWWQALMDMVMDLRVPGNFLTS